MSNIRTVKSHAKEEDAQNEVTGQYSKLLDFNLKIMHLHLSLATVSRLIPAGIKLLLLLWGVWQIKSGLWSLGELWALLGYTALVFAPAATIAGLDMEREAARSAADRVGELFERLPEENLTTGIVPDQLGGAVEAQNLCFGYHDKEMVLQNLSFTVNPGEKVGVIGESGSGKTTLMSLLLALCRPQTGLIRFDGIPLQDYNIRALRQKIGCVSQSPQFFTGTLKQNLSEKATLSECQAALNAAGAVELCDRLAEVVAECGENFSAGERVRIALARELLRQTDIFILDEPTANLDASHETELMQNFSGALRDKTTFLITHKPDLLAYCTQIIKPHAMP